jgi:hypothetical protein
MRIVWALPLWPVAKSDRRRLPLWQEVEDKKVDWVEDKRLYLPSIGQVGNLLYSNTWEAVRTLKRPIRGIDMRQSIRWICATSKMDGRMMDMKWGSKIDQTGVIPDSYIDREIDLCPVAQLTWVPVMTLPQGR